MDFSILENRLGLKFQDRSYLKQALTHRSFINDHPYPWPLGQNARLEFLGDAVLHLAVREYLFKRYPSHDEGELTRYASALENIATAATIAEQIGISDFLLLSRGQARDNYKNARARQLILGDAFEAVIGALFLDQGYDAAHGFVTTHLLTKADEFIAQLPRLDPKGRLQEFAQGLLQILPRYEVLGESGPDHDRTFTVGVYFNSDLIAQGEGRGKYVAEAKAAEAALVLKGWAVEETS